MAIGVDGYAEGRGADMSVMPLDDTFNVHNAERIRQAETLLYGAKTFRQMVGYWPGVPEESGHSEAEQEIAGYMADGKPVYAISDSLTEEDTKPWRDQTTIVRRADAHATVAALRDRDGDTVIFGSRTTWADLLKHGLIDEFYLMIGPKLVAGDVPVFDGAPVTDLRLVDVKRFADSESVVLHYAVRAG
ncbi:dihydrofolate reductase family protein [Amycolatopsis sp. OK19-0408]|uniref:Dihydrofolate reductase family protein n=1 Tax=Amycolatopsis iheyensis TaxID=2945988 RepID=A0A9X2SN79_9PSEU|nr:dihydrofolate reductase family protein [Amycolatopsis iheyensis]MCR6488677.1 dihydrofolate reductase family protein [Amycolatopsis iheyensis]